MGKDRNLKMEWRRATTVGLATAILSLWLSGVACSASQGPGRATAEAETAGNAVVYDFESYGAQGWDVSNKSGEKAFFIASVASEEAYEGQNALVLHTNLDYGDPDLGQGMVAAIYAGDLEGKPIKARVYVPVDFPIDYNRPHFLQLFCSDQKGKSLFGTYRNIHFHIPRGQWTEMELVPGRSQPVGGYMDPGFDPSDIVKIGLKIGAGAGSSATYDGPVYLDFVRASRTPLCVPASYRIFDFNQTTAADHASRNFGHGPYWDADPGWNAGAWDGSGISVANGELEIDAQFEIVENNDSLRKGFVYVETLPNFGLSRQTNRKLRAEMRFDPPFPPDGLSVSFWVYDRVDAGPEYKWYRSREIKAGGSAVNEIVFDLDDPEHYDPVCADCLGHEDLNEQSLKNILKAGLQFWSDIDYSGTIRIDNVTVGGAVKPPDGSGAIRGFVRRDGSDLSLNGKPYRFAGANNYYLFYKSPWMIDNLMKTLSKNGIQALRTWAFCDGKAPFADDGDGLPDGNEGSCLQPEKGLYYEPSWKHFDYILERASHYGIRLILPLVNYWSDLDSETGQNSFGGMFQYLEWCGIAPDYDPDGKIRNKDLFYSNECARQAYKDYVEFVLQRVNTLTGIRYKDDPAILAFELANEPRCQNGEHCNGSRFLDWVEEMAAFFKSIDGNHLLAVGDEGFFARTGESDNYYNGYFGVDWEALLAVENIDFGTVHMYPDHWEKDLNWTHAWIENHVVAAEEAGKPILIEEYGYLEKTGRPAVYEEWFRRFEANPAPGVDGSLIWMIADVVNPGEPGLEIGGKVYQPDFDGFSICEPDEEMALLAEHAANMRDDDGDGLSNGLEKVGCTSENKMDTDGDGIPDGLEDKNKNNRRDGNETDPCKADTDDDNFSDSEEKCAGTDPLNSSSFPTVVCTDPLASCEGCHTESLSCEIRIEDAVDVCLANKQANSTGLVFVGPGDYCQGTVEIGEGVVLLFKSGAATLR